MSTLSLGSLLWFLPLSVLPLVYFCFSRSRRSREHVVPHSRERVLILGASSGVGRAMAHIYASRNAHLCIVGRRQDKLESVRQECVDLLPSGEHTKILHLSEDFSDPEGLLRIRDLLAQQWNGLDTLVLSAGVAALQPLLSIAGLKSSGAGMADVEGLIHVRDVAAAAMQGNFTGPLLSAVTYIPLLTQTSKSPSILLVSSVAAVIPAPTRSLYAASKASSLILFKALSIEHPHVHFTTVLPATVSPFPVLPARLNRTHLNNKIEGDFRASAIDGGVVHKDVIKGLKRDHVARQCVRAIDDRQRTIWLPRAYRFVHLLYWIYPRPVDAGAGKKYNFKP